MVAGKEPVSDLKVTENPSVPKSNDPLLRVHSKSRSRDRTNYPQQQPWTLTSDSDLLSDISVETESHSGCWLIPITVEGIKTLALTDTGASVSVMGRPLYQKVQQVSQLRLQMQDTPRLEGVGGNPVPSLGHAAVQVGIGDGVYKATFVVSARRERPNFIIGADFLAGHNCDLSLRQKLFIIGKQEIQCIPENIRANYAKVKVARRIQLPPQTDVMVSCEANKGVKYFGMPNAVAQPADNSWRYAEDGLVIGSSLTASDSETHYLPVMNLSDAPRTLYAGARIGEVYSVTSLKRAHEMFEVDLPFSDWDFDSDDGELVDVRTTVTKDGGSLPHRNEHQDVRMNLKDLPEHLQPLMEWVAEDLTVREREELAGAIYEYKDVFSSGPNDMGQTDLVTHTIDTGENRLIRLPLRRLPITKHDVEQAEVQKMLDRGVIEPCQSSWASPVVLVTKKDGSTRFCVDYHKLNNLTHKDVYPLPRIDDTLDDFWGSQYFSTLDSYSGYWQVKMDSADIDKTAFVTRQGLFRFTVMAFGLCNALATFERLMEVVLSGLNWKICLIYLDNVIVYGGNFYNSLDRLKTVWQWIREASLKLKPSKCCLMHDRVLFLGHYVLRDGVEVDPMKTTAVQDWPTPGSVKDVQAFLGLASYYRRYIPNFASVATPLTGLTKKDAKFIWNDDCEQAFQALKKALVQPPVLAYPTRDGHFIVSTDASDTGMGAVLEQEQEEGGRVVKRVIAYASKHSM